jgi:hypothetical protein
MMSFQTGFMPNGQISDNGWTLQTLMAHARKADPQGLAVGVLLDQEKAYDSVHPEYLEQVMQAIGIPYMLTQCIVKLFFSTSVYISINGFLAPPFTQNRGLRQGDLYLLFCLTSLSNRYYEDYITTQTFWDAPSLPYHGNITRRALDTMLSSLMLFQSKFLPTQMTC